jgi:hypothetical protein
VDSEADRPLHIAGEQLVLVRPEEVQHGALVHVFDHLHAPQLSTAHARARARALGGGGGGARAWRRARVVACARAP